MQKFFTAHPRSVNETYWQHMAVALGFAMALAGAGLAALVHAFFPAWFEKTASGKIVQLHEELLHSRTKSANDKALQPKTSETARQI